MNKRINRERAISNLGKEAQERVIKNEVMRFRLEAETLADLLMVSNKLNKPAGTLIREWVIEKLNQIKSGDKESPEVKAINLIAASLAEHGLLKSKQIDHIHELLARQNNNNNINA